jgi:hypothetical protein
MNHRVVRFVQDGRALAYLQIPPDCPSAVVARAEKLVAEDLKTYTAPPPPKSYLEMALALGRSVSEAVDARVRARVFAEPTKAYREHLLDVLHDDPELAAAYRDGV